jgi:hypothetical protein
MKIGPLSLFRKGVNQFVIAALHHPWSITWRWVATYDRTVSSKRIFLPRWHFCRVYRGYGFNFHATLVLPILGNLHRISLQTQPNLPHKESP